VCFSGTEADERAAEKRKERLEASEKENANA
jgi:hypothetical protein